MNNVFCSIYDYFTGRRIFGISSFQRAVQKSGSFLYRFFSYDTRQKADIFQGWCWEVLIKIIQAYNKTDFYPLLCMDVSET